uniref:hypothetical protein n=1 Tax=Cytobacillus oceanisediminis TaxID=665099 RepID=UPI001642DBB7
EKLFGYQEHGVLFAIGEINQILVQLKRIKIVKGLEEKWNVMVVVEKGVGDKNVWKEGSRMNVFVIEEVLKDVVWRREG